jgi:arsenate reductase
MTTAYPEGAIFMNVTIYHNPRCSKSRKTLDLLRERNIEPEIIDYLANPPNATELAALLGKLDMGVTDIMRTGEQDYRAADEKLAAMSEADLIDWLCRHPKVMQRPIVVVDQQARLGRPPELVLEMLS